MTSTSPAVWGENFDILSFASVASLGLLEMVHDDNSAL